MKKYSFVLYNKSHSIYPAEWIIAISSSWTKVHSCFPTIPFLDGSVYMIPLTSSSYSLDQGQLLEFPEPIAQIAVGSKYVVALSSTNQLYILPIPY